MGKQDDYVEGMTSEYSKYCHPFINLVYGYRHKDEDRELLIIREHVYGKNYYSIEKYEHLGDRLIGFYKVLCLVEYIHSFKGYLRVIRPEKFILGGGLTYVKMVDVIKNDERYLENLRIDDTCKTGARFLHPELLAASFEDDGLERSVDYDKVRRADVWSVGCFLYYAITKVEPWANLDKPSQIYEAYKDKGYLGFFDESLIKTPKGQHDQVLLEWLHKCFKNEWGDDLTKFRETMEEKRENIAKYIKDDDDGGMLEMDYDKATREEWEEIRDKYLPDLHLYDD
jgi:serine/threonine protein kinase